MEKLDWDIDWTKDHWYAIKNYAIDDGLAAFLKRIPRSKWNNRHPESSSTLLHLACMYRHEKRGGTEIVTLSKVIDVYSRSSFRTSSDSTITWTPIHLACDWNNSRNVELILAAGFNNKLDCLNGLSSPLSYCLPGYTCLQVLVSNGYRLKQEHFGTDLSLFPCDIINLENGFVKCRDVIVTLLGLKKRRVILPKLDRFLVQQELAVAIWTTRTSESWQ